MSNGKKYLIKKTKLEKYAGGSFHFHIDKKVVEFIELDQTETKEYDLIIKESDGDENAV